MASFTKRLTFIAGCLLLFSAPAQATNKVSSPDVTQGKTEFEYRGGYDWDSVDSKDSIDQHKFVANHGLTDRWRMEVKADYASHADDKDHDWTFFEWSNRFQILKDDNADSLLPKLSIQANYKFSLIDNKADKLEGTLLLSKNLWGFTHVTNINFENEVGANAAAGTDFNLGWKSQYHYMPVFDPGFEFYADFGKVIGPVPAGARKYSAGPVFYGKLTGNVKYEVGYLFGLSPAAPDGRLKGILTYGF